MLRRALTAALTVLALGACTADAPPPPARSFPARPNIVFVLTDDLTPDLLRFMPRVRALMRAGTSFAQYTVTDSLCCPSRASILSGKYPHNTGVFTNTGADGGIGAFRRGADRSTYATDLRAAGYRTALYGKYLNGYTVRSGHVPPGWLEWGVAGPDGYAMTDFDLLENGRAVHHGGYLNEVLTAKTQDFVRRAVAARQPFLVQLSTFTPHRPYTPAPRDARLFPGLTAPRTPAFDRLPTAAPRWLAGRAALSTASIARLDAAYRKRAQSVVSVDRMLGEVQATLAERGVAGNTVVVFSSDNGYHLGEHRLNPGKQTAFETDLRVPLIMAGPGIRAGATVRAPALNADLRPTFAALAGLTPPADADGRDLTPLLRGERPPAWRTVALVEHHGPPTDPTDPDRQTWAAGNPTTYSALRTPRWTYVEYADGFLEYYNRTRDPHQLRNIAAALPLARRAALHRKLATLTACRGPAACHAADR
ncbi:sulfatase family protein [Actinoplanes sp. RD1]|uniref:sulfatase family protein n=1 Tax=Actinoplanes sp. RD1 TaxID=3064538 RepID=UPI002741B6C7|nr:sulfatase [Actinoplanes sp. RD1]